MAEIDGRAATLSLTFLHAGGDRAVCGLPAPTSAAPRFSRGEMPISTGLHLLIMLHLPYQGVQCPSVTGDCQVVLIKPA